MHTEQTRPYIILRKEKNTDYEIEVKPASVRKDFFENTLHSHGYHCQPLTTASMHGWEFILPHDVEVVWDGISNTEKSHVKIIQGEFLKSGRRFLDTSTANSTIAFNLHSFFETDPDHYILLFGPANHFIKGAKPMSALIRSDWYHHNHLQYCWILTTPNKNVFFPKGTPFLTVVNYPKSLLEQTDFFIKDITDEQKNKQLSYGSDRSSFKPEAPFQFPFMYKKGVDGLSENSNKYIDKTFRPSPGKVIYE